MTGENPQKFLISKFYSQILSDFRKNDIKNLHKFAKICGLITWMKLRNGAPNIIGI